MHPATSRALTAALVLTSTAAHAATYTAGNGNGNTDTWNVATNWAGSDVPDGAESALISSGNAIADAGGLTSGYTGSLTIADGAGVKIIGDDDLQALGGGTISLGANSSLRLRGIGAETLAYAFALTGDGSTLSISESTQSGGLVQFNGAFSGAFSINVGGANNGRAQFNAANAFDGVTTLGDRGFNDENFVLVANAAGALGVGDVNIIATDSLLISAAGAIADDATLTLTGAKSSKVSGKLNVNAGIDEVVGALIVDGSSIGPGTYNSSESWLAGSGTVTVLPEPSSLALLGLGGVLMTVRSRRD